MKESKGDPQTYAIIGAAMEVHRVLGCGFLEQVYQEALALEFTDRAIPFVAQAPITIAYRGRRLTAGYRVDFICFETIIVELKALTRLSTIEEAQAINYLKASKLERAVLLNFGNMSLEYKRLVLN
jgi:GxxExxY protein